MKTNKKTGYLVQDGVRKFSGDYVIEIKEVSDAQPKPSGKIKLSGIPREKLLKMLSKPFGPFDLVDEKDVKKCTIAELTFILGSENWDEGSAEFKLWFMPGEQID